MGDYCHRARQAAGGFRPAARWRGAAARGVRWGARRGASGAQFHAAAGAAAAAARKTSPGGPVRRQGKHPGWHPVRRAARAPPDTNRPSATTATKPGKAREGIPRCVSPKLAVY